PRGFGEDAALCRDADVQADSRKPNKARRNGRKTNPSLPPSARHIMLKARADGASNVRWVSFSQLGRLIIQLSGIAVLSRLLAPSDYGLLAMALIVITFANVLKDMGTANAIIQKQEISPKLLDTIFWFNL